VYKEKYEGKFARGWVDGAGTNSESTIQYDRASGSKRLGKASDLHLVIQRDGEKNREKKKGFRKGKEKGAK